MSDDPMELVHCHLAKEPLSLLDRPTTFIPDPLAKVVHRLMAKNAEDRYQSAWGLKADLETCWEQWQQTRQMTAFPLGRQDVTDRLQIPQKLYGRESEIAQLLAAFYRATDLATASAIRDRSAAAIVVTGYSGIGKSALVRSLYHPLTQKRGYFITGKFDQFQRNIPYSALVQAFMELVTQLLGEPETQLQRWRTKIQAALGSNGQVIVTIIPELALIIGPQPAVPELSGPDAQNRFNLVFRKFIQVFCSPDHPLVIFLDDCQWVDVATLHLLETLLGEGQPDYLLLILAYRDNEVDTTHPLTLTENNLQRVGIQLERITLKPLLLNQVIDLISETLNKPSEHVKALAKLIFRKTGGNPFFVKQFLRTLANERILLFEHGQRQWHWNLAQIKQMNFTDNVVELMIERLRTLPSLAQQLLSTAACLGTEFNLAMLVLVHQQKPAIIFEQLKLMIDQDLIVAKSTLDENLLIQDYQFGHDRIQQAAYALIPEAKKQAIHYQIGHHLLAQTSVADRSETIFELVNHINLAHPLIIDLAERQQIAELNLLAGQTAKRSTAYEAAIAYLNLGNQLLAGEQAWTDTYPLAFALHLAIAEVQLTTVDFAALNQTTALLLNHAKSSADIAQIYEIKVTQATLQGQYQKAVQVGLEGLQNIGIPVEREQLEALIATELDTIEQYLEAQANASALQALLDLPVATDPNVCSTMKLLLSLDAPTYLIPDLDLYSFVSLRIIRLSIEHGNTPESVKAYGNYGFILGLRNQHRQGFEFANLGIQLSHKLNSQSQQCRVSAVTGGWIQVWAKHIQGAAQINYEGFLAGMEAGDIQFAAYNVYCHVCNRLFAGDHLDAIATDIVKYLQVAANLKNEILQSMLEAVQFFVCQLLQDLEVLDRQHLARDTQNWVERHKTAQAAMPLAIYDILQMQLACICRTFEVGLCHAEAARQRLEACQGFTISGLYHFYNALIFLGLPAHQSAAAAAIAQQQVETSQAQLKAWSDSCPENFEHKYLLVAAERSRQEGDFINAMDLYDRAIAGAQQYGFIQEEALAYELAAHFYLALNKDIIAHAYLQEARYCYLHWGAGTKVNQLSTQFPQRLRSTSRDHSAAIASSGSASTTGDISLDLATLMKASRAITSEIDLDTLLQALMAILLENAGASSGYLLLPAAETGETLEDFAIAIAKDANGTNLNPPHPISEVLPISVLQYVLRSRESFLLGDPDQPDLVSRDPYLNAHLKAAIPLSVLCYALLDRGQLVGIVYLENEVTAEAFTHSRVEFLQLLSGQAATAIINARLYRKVKQAEQVLTNYSQHLEREVQARTAEVAEANTQLQQANQQLQRMATLDGLTQIANRRYFDQQLQQEWQRLLRNQKPLALILFDVDYFKRYNDYYGHQAGDACLIQIAQVATLALNRSTDLVARYGGEEFGVILPETTLQGAVVVAQRIQTRLRELALPHAQSEVSDIVSLSLGIADLIPESISSPEQLIMLADKALYQAKQQGRDRYSAYEMLSQAPNKDT
jgi:diguanylate cyclase (GGDEF)-like protein